MTPCDVCGTEIDAVTTMFIVTEFIELGAISLRHALCSPSCLGEFADRIELAVEGGASS